MTIPLPACATRENLLALLSLHGVRASGVLCDQLGLSYQDLRVLATHEWFEEGCASWRLSPAGLREARRRGLDPIEVKDKDPLARARRLLRRARNVWNAREALARDFPRPVKPTTDEV